ncbi:unnamed protein product [Amoebophrya sp. A120]|nr:unnamed protein product [Amoebophrya sp. A120]|eukprot:GSA120T00011085001.1
MRANATATNTKINMKDTTEQRKCSNQYACNNMSCLS